jgi:hypothetical protein
MVVLRHADCMRSLAPAVLVLVACGLAAACESSARVGEIRPSEDGGPPSTLPPVSTEDGGGKTDEQVWTLHTPSVPCSIYAMGEARADALYIGCNGGRIYRYDGVRAELVFEAEETRIFSLLWVAPDGKVWAGAQEGYDENATTQLYRFDGQTWAKVGGSSERLTALSGSGASVWAATRTELRRFDGTEFTASYTAPVGSELRACSFVAPDKGWCTGTKGLAVAWNGTAWTPMTSAPWSAQAEVFGVEVGGWFDDRPIFFYGEPVDDPTGDHSVRVARFTGTSFTSFAASRLAFGSYDLSRTRTGQVNVGGRSYALLALDDQYGGAMLFDPIDDAIRPLCGPVLAFSAGSAKTRAGGFNGLLATVVGSGGNQVALTTPSEPFEFEDLSVASDGTAWARVEDPTVCGSVTNRVVRFDGARWGDVAGPQPVQSGRGLAAIGLDRAFTLTVPDDTLAEYGAATWTDRATMPSAWSLWAKNADDVWIGGYKDELAHFDGTKLDVLLHAGKGRQVRQITSDGAKEVWMVALGYTQDDTDVHVYRWADGKRAEWDLGLERGNTNISALDATHVWMSGSPARAWDGTTWKRLSFDASNVWARSPSEVYFTRGGDIFRWDGSKLERVYHGFTRIRFIDGWKSGALAVGPGGLTIELRNPDPTIEK